MGVQLDAQMRWTAARMRLTAERPQMCQRRGSKEEEREREVSSDVLDGGEVEV